VLRGGWFVCSSRSLPFPAILRTLVLGRVAGGLVPTTVLPALLAWVLASSCCAGTPRPQKPLNGETWGHRGAGLQLAVATKCQVPAATPQRALPGAAEVCAPAAPSTGQSWGWQDLRAELGLGRGV